MEVARRLVRRTPRRRPPWSTLPAPGLAIVGLSVLLLLSAGGSSFRSTPPGPQSSPAGGVSTSAHALGARTSVRIASGPPITLGPLSLSASTSGPSVCAYGFATCAGTSATVRVNLTVAAPPLAVGNSTSVDVLYLLDISLLTACEPADDGSCPAGWSPIVPTFLGSAGTIASALASRHPAANLSFGLAITDATYGADDDGDGSLLAVPIGNFTNASQFGATVNRSFQMPGDIDGADNPLQTGEIAAMYGLFTGQTGATYSPVQGQANWTPQSDRVVVWVGAAAPVDANFSEDVCPLANLSFDCSVNNGTMPTCEYPVNFTGGPIPSCEGWLTSQNGNASDSIAALAYTGAECVGSSLGHCTVDSVVANATPSNPGSPGWTPKNVSGDNISDVRNDTAHVVAAGCDMALATGGSWDGPRNSSCGNSTGTLGFSGNTTNPELLSALANVSLGTSGPPGPVAAPVPGTAMFRFVTTSSFAAAPSLDPSVSCSSPAGPVPGCASLPIRQQANGSTVLTWNWSDTAGHSAMQPGDTWSASFDLVPTVGPANATALDACATPVCRAAENGSSLSTFSGATFAVDGSTVVLAESFPLLTVTIAAPANLSGSLRSPDPAADAPAAVGFGIQVSGGYPPYVADWQFGDGSVGVTNTTLNTTHVYTRQGLYRADAEVRDSAGSIVRLTEWVTIFPALTALVSPLNATGEAPLFVTLNAIPLGGDGPYTVLWTFGNGTTAAGSTTYSTFSQPGTYAVSVNVTDVLGRSFVSTVPVTVDAVPAPVAPMPITIQATAAYDGPNGCGVASAKVLFSAQAGGGTAPYSYSWNFGDGSFAAGPFVNHTFTRSPNPLRVSVVVTDAAGRFAETNLTSASGPTPVDRACPVAELDSVLSPMDLTLGSIGLMAGAALALVVLWRRE
jgi:hypothetical protein